MSKAEESTESAMSRSLLLPLDQVAAVLDALNCGALLLDRSGRVLHANARLCEMFGLTCEELIGDNLHRLYRAENGSRHLDRALESLDQATETEFYILRSDGTKLPVILSGRQLFEAPRLPEHRIITVVDVSRQKHAEDQCRDQYRELSKLSDTCIEQTIELKTYSSALEERVRERTAELHEANIEAVFMLGVASEAKDSDTGAHVRRIQHYSTAIARKLGLSDDQAERIGLSAVLHDVGKIHVPDRILKKPGKLTKEERAIMEAHTVAGEHILSRKKFFDIARRIARSHHENWDGSGYPDGLSSTAIPLSARIVHIADVFDALVSERVYKPAWTVNRAEQHVRNASGRSFDPEVAAAFLGLLSSGELDALVG